MFSNDCTQKNPCIFVCKNCDFATANKKDYGRHIQTKKHKINENQCLSMENTPKPQYECSCGKTYKDNSGLWRHKKKCINLKQDGNKNENESKNKIPELSAELVLCILKQNNEFQELIWEQNKTILELSKNNQINNSHNTNTNNSHNKSFNLQFFLNETCKNAMNITDFVDSIKLQLSDLINIGEVGYVEGISNIITNNLKALDVTQRPVHCADKKREVLYVKDEDKWEKEDTEKKKIRRAITKIANKNYVLIPQFKEKYPECAKSSSPLSTQYNKIIIEAMGGSGDNDLEKENKIIKNISKVIAIEKEVD
jgi:hypothetical protein